MHEIAWCMGAWATLCGLVALRVKSSKKRVSWFKSQANMVLDSRFSHRRSGTFRGGGSRWWNHLKTTRGFRPSVVIYSPRQQWYSDKNVAGGSVKFDLNTFENEEGLRCEEARHFWNQIIKKASEVENWCRRHSFQLIRQPISCACIMWWTVLGSWCTAFAMWSWTCGLGGCCSCET